MNSSSDNTTHTDEILETFALQFLENLGRIISWYCHIDIPFLNRISFSNFD